MPQVSGSIQGNYPFWERGGRFVIETVGGGSGFGGEHSSDATGGVIPWPVALMRRVLSFEYEEDEMQPSKLTLVLDNGDYALTELTRDPGRDAVAAVGQTQALMGPASVGENVYLAYGNPSDVPASDKRYPFVGQLHRLEYRHLFELGTTLSCRYGYGDPAMSPTRVVRVTTITGWEEITVVAYEVHFAYGTLYRTANWTMTGGGGLQAIASNPVLANVFADAGVQFKTRSSADGVNLDVAIGNPFAVHSTGSGALDRTTQTGSAGKPNAVGASASRVAASDVANKKEPDVAGSAIESVTSPSIPGRGGHPVGIYLGDRYARYFPQATDGRTPTQSVSADGFEGRPLVFEEDEQGYPHIGLVATIARRYGFRAVVEERYIDVLGDGSLKEIRYPYAQVNINDMAFLQQSAVWLGYAFWVELASDFIDLKLKGNPNKKPLGTFFFMPRMYWQQPYATYVWGMEIDQSRPILPSGAVYDRPGDVAILFDRILEFDEPSIDSRQKSTLFGGKDINPLTGAEYSAANAVQKGFRFKKLGLDWYDFHAINQGFDEQAFNRVRDSGSSGSGGQGSVPPQGKVLNAAQLAAEMAKPVDQMNIDLIVRSLEGITLEQEPFIFGLNANVPAFQDADPYDKQFADHQATAQTGQTGGLSAAREERLRRLLIFRAQQESKQTDEVAKILLQAQASLDALAQRRPGVNGSASSMRQATAELWSLIERFTGDYMNDLEGSMTSRMSVLGDPFLQARRLLKTQGLGVYSGLWYAKKATHTIDNGGYQTKVDLMTNRIPTNTRKFRRSSLEGELNQYDVGITEARLKIQDVIDRADIIKSQLEQAIEQDTATAAAQAQEKAARAAIYHDAGSNIDTISLLGNGGSANFRPRFSLGTSAQNPKGSYSSWEDWNENAKLVKTMPCAVLKILKKWADIINGRTSDMDAIRDSDWFTSPFDPSTFDRRLTSKGQGGLNTQGLMARSIAFMYYIAFVGWNVGYGGSGPVKNTPFGLAATNNKWGPETWTIDTGRLSILQAMAFVAEPMRVKHFARTHEYNTIFSHRAIENLPVRPDCGEQDSAALKPAQKNNGGVAESSKSNAAERAIPFSTEPTPDKGWKGGEIGVFRVNEGSAISYYMISYSGKLDSPAKVKVNAWTSVPSLNELRRQVNLVRGKRTIKGRGIGNLQTKNGNYTEDAAFSYKINELKLPSASLD